MRRVTVKALRRAEKLLLDAFGKAMPVVNWAFFIVGVAGAAGTVAGVLPPFSDSLWAKLTSVLLWLLFAREGYDSLVEQDEVESSGRSE